MKGGSIYINADELEFLYWQLLNMDDDLEDEQAPRDSLLEKLVILRNESK